MLKITTAERNGQTVVLKLEGKIIDQWAALLDRECRAALLHHGRVELDCAAVDFMDQRGIEVMKSLPRKQVTLIGAPGFVMELLQTGGRS